MIRTTTNMLRCLLFQASLPASYWAEALHTATHLLNRLPSKAVRHPTPHFALYGTTPSYDHLRVFGCACYPNTSATAPHKLSPRSTRCLFLGYSPDHKGYRCLDLTSHRIIISRHVIFDEDVFPLAGSTPPTDLDSLLESDPIPPPPAPRLAPLPAPRAATTPPLMTSSTPRAAPSTPPAPRVAPSTPPTSRAAPSTTPMPRVAPSTMPAPRAAPSTPTRFANPTVVYHRRAPAIPAALDVPAVRSESSVYHPVAIHRDPGHVHPMVTRRAASVLRPIDRLILAAATSSTPPDASQCPPLFALPSPTHIGVILWRRSTRPSWPTTPGTWCRVHQAPTWSLASGYCATS
jgi:hypothetical protein